MAEQLRRRISATRVALIVGVSGIIAGLGLGRATAPPVIDVDPSATRTPTIGGTDIRDRSLTFKDIRTGELEKHFYDRSTANKRFVKVRGSEATIARIVKDAGYVTMDALGLWIKRDEADSRYLEPAEGDARYMKRDANLITGVGQLVTGSRLVGETPERLFEVAGLMAANVRAFLSPNTPPQFGIRLFNFTDQEFHFTRSDTNTMGTIPAHDSVDTGPIAAWGPVNFQVIAGAGDGAAVHTLHFSGFVQGSEVQVLAQGVMGVKG